MSEEKYFSTIEEFIKETPAKKMIAHAFKEICPNKNNRFSTCIIFALALSFAVYIGVDENTIKILTAIEGIILSAQLNIFAYLFTIYTILLAFLSDKYIKALSKVCEVDGVSSLKKRTSYYESILFLYFIGLAITGVLSLFLNCLQNDWSLTPDQGINSSITILFLLVYFFYTFRIFYELKSTIYNTIVMFRESITYKILIIAKNEKEEVMGKTGNKGKEGEFIDNNSK
ncbi:MAG: hypothetical protein ABFC84_11780 [Veillonellales bacterium]